MPKRNDRVAPPPGDGEWDVRFGTSDAAKGWESLCTQAAGNTLKAWRTLRSQPRAIPPSGRHHQLKGALATDAGLEQWQIEVTGGGRIHYVIDDDKHTVFIRAASTGHPKKTE